MKRVLFVDGDTAALEQLRQELRRHPRDWQEELTDNGLDAWELFQARPFDAVVTSNRIGKLNWEELLKKVRDQHPTAVRLIASSPSESESILWLWGVAHQVLPRPLSMPALWSCLDRAFALRGLLKSPELVSLVTRIQALPSLPPLYIEMLEALRDEQISIPRISQLVLRDLGMCSKILQLVNSAYFGIPHTVYRLEEAIAYLGIEMVRVLVISLQIFSLFETNRVPDFPYENLWKHSWRTGMTARRIAEAEGLSYSIVDQAFLAGLLHDVGKLLLATSYTQQYREVRQALQKVLLADWEAEKKVLNSTHAEVGAYLLSLWGLPDAIVEAVAWHHRPSEKPVSDLDPVALVHFANAVDHAAQVPPALMEMGWLDRPFLNKLGLGERFSHWCELVSRNSF
ncbi:MAG TPA: response regulator [Verrucomicrobiota bacterium]|nr:response regulator [Verrucomicrobiota bacterium]